MNLLVIHHRPVFPPVGGGSRVILDLYEELADRGYNILILSVVRRPRYSIRKKGLRYLEVPEDLLSELALFFTRGLNWATNERTLFLHMYLLTKIYPHVSDKLHRIVKNFKPHVIISEQPYTSLLAWRLAMTRDNPMILREHNIEAEYLAKLSYTKLSELALNLFWTLEKAALSMSSSVIAISYRDYNILSQQLPSIREKITYAPPLLRTKGTDLGELCLRKLGAEPYNYVLFVASKHLFNIHALEALIKAAESTKSIKFIVAGTICEYLRRFQRIPQNVKALGVVDDNMLHTLYKHSLLVYAPFTHGTGVPVKLVEAIIYGAPTVSTPNVLNTIQGLKHKVNIYVARLNDMPLAIKEITELNTPEILRKNVKKLSKNLTPQRVVEIYEDIIKTASSRFTNFIGSC